MTPRQQLEEMIDRFDPEIAAIGRGAIARLRKLIPGAIELVYDNTYALVIGFGPDERASEAFVSVAMYPRKVGLCFIWGVELEDPEKRLQGGGRQVRHIRLSTPKDLDQAWVKKFIRAAVKNGEPVKGKKTRVEIRTEVGKRRTRTTSSRASHL